MKAWIIVAIVACLLVAGVFVVNAAISSSSASNADAKNCGSCQGKCTSSENCGLASCSSATGGKCNCGK